MNTVQSWLVGFFTDYQVWATFVAAFVGFGGVIFTLVAQRHFDLELDAKKTEEERQRYIAALSTELLGVREYAKGALEHITPADDFLMPREPPFLVFDVLSHKMDLLSPAQVQSVRHCYVWLREIAARASLLQVTPSSSNAYICVPAQHLHVIRALFEHLEIQATRALCDLDWPGEKRP